MDKKDIKEYIKVITKIYIGIIIIFALPVNIIFSIISGIGEGKVIELIISNTISLLVAIVCLGIFIYSVIGLIYIFSLIKRRKETIKTDEYVRDLPKNFSPAIASFLLDLSTETTTDYTATIAYLMSKKYIELVGEDNIHILNNNLTNLSAHEKYVFNCITQQKIFNHNEFRQLVVSDAETMNLIKKGKRKINFLRNFGIALGMYFLFGIIINYVFKTGILNIIFSILGMISTFSIFGVIGYSIYLSIKYQNESFHRTQIGKEEAIKWSGLKKFFQNYTLVSDKNLKDIVVLDEYIPYAISLNEAKSIEKYIEENESYRKLIYGNTFNFKTDN